MNSNTKLANHTLDSQDTCTRVCIRFLRCMRSLSKLTLRQCREEVSCPRRRILQSNARATLRTTQHVSSNTMCSHVHGCSLQQIDFLLKNEFPESAGKFTLTSTCKCTETIHDVPSFKLRRIFAVISCGEIRCSKSSTTDLSVYSTLLSVPGQT